MCRFVSLVSVSMRCVKLLAVSNVGGIMNALVFTEIVCCVNLCESSVYKGWLCG